MRRQEDGVATLKTIAPDHESVRIIQIDNKKTQNKQISD